MDAHEAGGRWLPREIWDFPRGVPEDDRVDYLKLIMPAPGAAPTSRHSSAAASTSSSAATPLTRIRPDPEVTGARSLTFWVPAF